MADDVIDPTSAADSTVLSVTNSLQDRSWAFRLEDERLALTLAQRCAISEILARVIAARGVTLESAASFLDPNLKTLMTDPAQVADMTHAVERIYEAIDGEETIAVFGDYDVDGATSSAVLVRFFRALGSDLRVYIPDRATEGYGPNKQAFQTLRDEGASLVLTVDCGTLAFEPLEYAGQIGLDVIVVDHHQPDNRLPEAVAVINPNRFDDQSGYGQLAAVGVSFLLIVALNRFLREQGYYDGRQEPDLLSLLDIVALGTVCDVVPLQGLNRAFVRQGLKVMQRRANVGLAALSDVSKIQSAPGAYELGYQLGPRVNAGGRVGKSDLGSRLLTTEDPRLAGDISVELDRLNQERKAIEAQVESAALAALEAQFSKDNAPSCIVCSGQGWHQGVIGIVASRLKDRYRRPSFVIAVDDEGIGKGSGRSIPGVDLGAAVVAAQAAGLLINGGGHPMAAGLTVDMSKLDELSAFLTTRLERQVQEAGKQNRFKIDGLLSLSGANLELLADLERAGPFGAGNSEPVFAFADVRIVRADIVGTNHVRCILSSDDGARLKAIAFRAVDKPLGLALLTAKAEPLHIAGKLRRDDWGGRTGVQLFIEDAARPHFGA